jgi:hypothetical protein
LPAQVWCDQCGASFFAEPEPEPAPAPPVRRAPPAPVPPPLAAPIPVTRKQPSFGALILLLGGGGLFVVLGLVLLGICLNRKDPAAEPSPSSPGTSPNGATQQAKREAPDKDQVQVTAKQDGSQTGDKSPKADAKSGDEGDPSPKLEVKFIETLTKKKVTKPRLLRLAVSPFRFDNMGALLTSLGEGYKWTPISEADLRSSNRLGGFDVIFLTCNATTRDDQELYDALRRFVQNGGTLYASDLRFAALQGAFPDLLAKKIHKTGKKQEVNARVVDRGLHDALGSDEVELTFNTPGWKPASFDRAQVKTYLEGWYVTEFGQKAFAPLLVSFTFGKGTVIFTSFHNSAQNSETELKLLRYLVFTAVTAEVEQKVLQMMAKGEFSPGPSTRLETSPQKPKVMRTYHHPKAGPLRFALGFANQGARLRLTLVSPDKKKVEREGKATFIIEIANAPAGEWQYTVTGLEVPFPHFPFTLTVGVPSKE